VCGFFLHFIDRSSAKVEEYERLLLKKTSFTKAQMKSCCPSYQHVQRERWPDVLGKDGNAGHYEGSQKYGVSATVCAVFYRNHFFTTDIWL